MSSLFCTMNWNVFCIPKPWICSSSFLLQIAQNRVWGGEQSLSKRRERLLLGYNGCTSIYLVACVSTPTCIFQYGEKFDYHAWYNTLYGDSAFFAKKKVVSGPGRDSLNQNRWNNIVIFFLQDVSFFFVHLGGHGVVDRERSSSLHLRRTQNQFHIGEVGY